MILRKYPLPQDIVAAGIDGILKVWSDNKVRGQAEEEQRNCTKPRRTALA